MQKSLPRACERCGSAALIDHQVGKSTVTVCASCGYGRDQLPLGRSRRRGSKRSMASSKKDRRPRHH